MELQLLEFPHRLREEKTRRDQRRLQGSWSWVAGRRHVQLLFVGEHFTARFRNGDIYVGTFRLDPLSRPRSIDLFLVEAPERHRNQICRGIYELDRDHLIWCPGKPGDPERPRVFPADDDLSRLCVVLKHQG